MLFKKETGACGAVIPHKKKPSISAAETCNNKNTSLNVCEDTIILQSTSKTSAGKNNCGQAYMDSQKISGENSPQAIANKAGFSPIGFINIDKPAGMSSAAVVGKIKRQLGVKKCGHMGTLDPLATGVLPIAIGNATRLFDYILQKEKVYVAKITFGKTTTTLDRAGETDAETDVLPNLQQVIEASEKLVGDIMQIPPKISAKHVNGQRSYMLARRGEEFTLEPKAVTINYIKFLDFHGPDTYEFEISCSGGTYIRSIARDLGQLSGSLAYMSDLRRIKSGVFSIESSVALDDFLSACEYTDFIMQPDKAVSFEKIILNSAEEKDALNGVLIKTHMPNGIYALYAAQFLGLGEVKNNSLKMRAHIR